MGKKSRKNFSIIKSTININKNRNIVFLIPTLGAGGAEKQFILLSNELLNHNFKTYFVLTQNNNSFYNTLGTKSIILKANVEKGFFSHIAKFISLIKFVKEKQINIVFSCYESKITTVYSRLLKFIFKDIIIISGYRNSIMHKHYILLDKMTNYLCDTMIANNVDVCKQMMESIPRAKRKMTHIPNIVDEKGFYKLDKKKSKKARDHYFPDVENKIVILGCFASYKPQKNQILLVEGMHFLNVQSKMPNIEIHCFGDKNCNNSQYKIIKKSINKYGLEKKIKLHDSVTEMNLYINSVNGVILVSHFEGFPNIIMEAILCEKPCIISDVANNMGLIDKGNGLVYKHNNVKDLAEKLLNFTTMELNQNNSKKEFLLKHNSLKSVTDKYITAFDSIGSKKILKY